MLRDLGCGHKEIIHSTYSGVGRVLLSCERTKSGAGELKIV